MDKSQIIINLNNRHDLLKIDTTIFNLMKTDPERYSGFTSSIDQIELGIKYFIAQQLSKDGNSEEVETLIRNFSNNLFGHATSENGRPDKVIAALKEFVEKTNFS